MRGCCAVQGRALPRILSDAWWWTRGPRWQSLCRWRRGTSTATEAVPTSLPTEARVVICGGGIVGTAVAYHLSKLGWKEILLLEQGRLGAGTTRFCAGIVSTVKHRSIETKMADYSNKLYQQLEQETGIKTGYVKSGSLSLAQTQDRLISLRRLVSRLKVMGIDCDIVTPRQVANLHPLINIHDLVGAMHVPGDAIVSSADVNLALATSAVQNGVQIHERTSVTHVLVEKGHVIGVETDRGHIDCDYFVNCAGQWAYELGLSNEEPVTIPLHACEHFYLLTQPLQPPLQPSLPVITDLDGRIYIRDWRGGVLSGGFEKTPKPLFTEGRNQLEFSNMHEDWDQFEPLLSALLRRMPALESSEILQLVNCPESFTPDMRCIMGETPNVRGYFVLAGMNSAGASLAGGAGRYLAEWMVYGYPSDSMWPLDIKRFGALQSSRTFLRHRVMEVMPLIYELKVPRWDFQTGRQLRTSPLYDRLDAQGARWMEKHGFERAKFFVPPAKDLLALDQSKTFYKPDWFDIVGSEVKCCKEAVCVIDMSSFTKFELNSTGDQALELLQRLCSNDLDVPVGHIVHTGMLNERGGYENDCSVVRLNKRSFMIISPTDQQVHCWAWLKQHMPSDSNLLLEDVTWKYTALNLIGPRAVDVLSELSYVPMTPDHFPSLFCKEMSVGYANGIRVMSMTHTGEPGFIIYIPIEYALHVYNEVMSVGQKYGIRNAGYYALRSLRIERFFAFWGQDLDNFTTPLECGREFRVKFDKDTDFIGREALLFQRQEGVTRRFTMFILEDHNTDLDLWPWWGEPIFRNGHYVGTTTSSAYSYTLQQHVCLGFVQHFDLETGERLVVTPDFINRGEYKIEIGGQCFRAKAKLYPFSNLFAQKWQKDAMELGDVQSK
ncbi:pyruvate dehydrogenase phosphatase regulatory subunit, mitochondrial isoform X1 [Latimeria chalumnae]|uniref:pyruvate dehydrogenase phosphatase regulatory subunit, mitochondrial isoform X1 n=2 Tax=Latimeria chalumnae TaxID=7897 RepID=UPI0006D8E5BE|nr:PREDICTED: pyruvate dehydrogenase phosphatase regulatory subunit, mitochondrial [Latimeria chalumnae]XP_014348663.1 PREDICTED: pyruvate dehydrogenase phosphatase regulatory subunit, mitochondrial [Latimeria chalumnae]|eukprot:XP_014348662.1 PREDICTED: pyruvate dehydrogenase phosphatase regulatory subunit, mitochondrial [Latimeria chalumnae]